MRIALFFRYQRSSFFCNCKNTEAKIQRGEMGLLGQIGELEPERNRESGRLPRFGNAERSHNCPKRATRDNSKERDGSSRTLEPFQAQFATSPRGLLASEDTTASSIAHFNTLKAIKTGTNATARFLFGLREIGSVFFTPQRNKSDGEAEENSKSENGREYKWRWREYEGKNHCGISNVKRIQRPKTSLMRIAPSCFIFYLVRKFP